MLGFTKAAVAVVLLAGSAAGQTEFLDAPMQAWAQVFAAMADNNGLVVSSDDSIVYATSASGGLGAMKRDDGTILWTFLPAADGASSNGEISFSSDGSSLYFAVSTGDTCQVNALSSSTGEVMWTSEALDGVCEGTAQITSDDMNVFVIHNSASSTVGHFSVLDADGATIYTYDDTNGPFSPMGFYPDPSPGGNYLAGSVNTNSLAIWGYKPTPTATGGETGGTFAFQMPASTSVAGPTVEVLLAYPLLEWRSTAPPLLAAMGQQLYWCVSRSKLKAWKGIVYGLASNGGADFGRGDPLFKAASYTPAVDNMEAPTIVCGGAADSTFACLEISDVDPYPLSWQNNLTTGVIAADPLFSTESDRIYYAENTGIFHSVDPSTGTEFWNAPTGVTVDANFAMTSDGAFLFFGDSTGNIVAWQVAESTLDPVPDTPSGGDTSAPSATGPSTDETKMPTDGGGAPTPTPTSGAASMAIFSVIAASVVSVAAFF